MVLLSETRVLKQAIKYHGNYEECSIKIVETIPGTNSTKLILLVTKLVINCSPWVAVKLIIVYFT